MEKPSGHQSAHATALSLFYRDRRLAHEVLFKHRHSIATPEFHGEMIDDWHNPLITKLVEEAFRDAAKSTLGEEATIVMAGFEEYRNGLIVSSTQDRAMDRLEAVAHEMEHNDLLAETFGSLRGDIWRGQKIVTQANVCIQAIGVGQSVRGVKYLDQRPDYLWIDDIEDDESVKTAEACHERLKWLYKTLLPACSVKRLVRMSGNQLSPQAVIVQVARDPAWTARRYPICYTDLETGEERATWPEKFPMSWIVETRGEYERLALTDAWNQEYMCQAIDEQAKAFKPEMYRIVPQVRTWHPVTVMYDPARTGESAVAHSVRKHRSRHGKAAWSWQGRKLIVWEAWARTMMPDKLIDDIFATDDKLAPTDIFVEEDGLQEWLHGAVRAEVLRRRHPLPHLHGVRAPQGKDDFIRAMQPFFQAMEVEFATDCPDARAQLLSFPAGQKDCVNALAYAWKLRPGAPMYDGFDNQNVIEDLDPLVNIRKFLVMNADGRMTAAALVQYDGSLEILADWIDDRQPDECAGDMLRLACLEAGANVFPVLPPPEFDPWRNHGLLAALNRVPAESRQGGAADRGRTEIRLLLGSRTRGLPRILVSSRAAWTLRAMAGGYCRKIDRRGQIAALPDEGVYRLLMEGIESFAALMGATAEEEDGDRPTGTWRTARDGRRYRSLIGDR